MTYTNASFGDQTQTTHVFSFLCLISREKQVKHNKRELSCVLETLCKYLQLSYEDVQPNDRFKLLKQIDKDF